MHAHNTKKTPHRVDTTFDFKFKKAVHEASCVPTALTVGSSHRIVSVNPAWVALCKTSEQATDGSTLPEHFGQIWLSLFDHALTSTSADAVSGCVALRNGVILDVATVIATPIGLNEQIVGLCVQLFLPSTIRMFMQEAEDIREANAQLLLSALREQSNASRARDHIAETEALLGTMSEGIVIVCGDSVLANGASRDLLGLGEEPTLRDFDACNFQNNDGECLRFRDLIARATCARQIENEEIGLLVRDGRTRHLVWSGGCLERRCRQAPSLIFAFRDVTHVHDLQLMRDRHMALISHDLRGPLGAASMAAQLLCRDPNIAERRLLQARRVVKNIDRADEMITTLLDAQRIRSNGMPPLKLATCHLTKLVQDVLDEITLVHGDRFVVSGDTQIEGVWGTSELRRAIWNLATNAVKYGAADCKVTLHLAQIANIVSISVHNYGPPLRASDMEKIFDAYERNQSTATSKPNGWGLGLTFVQGCAKAHGGSVEVCSTAEKGTTFTLKILHDATPRQDDADANSQVIPNAQVRKFSSAAAGEY